jgi:hypothetical protein
VKRGPMTVSTKQSRPAQKTLDCFVASLLAMTAHFVALFEVYEDYFCGPDSEMSRSARNTLL